MKVAEIRELAVDDLHAREKELGDQLFRLRIQKSMGQLETPVKLRLRLVDAEEYRFQKRPSGPRGRMTDLRLGTFDGLIYLNFDAFPLDPGDKPGVHDFRASDAFAAGKELWWEVV